MIVYYTLELWHPSFADPVRVVTGVHEAMNFTIEDGAARNGGETVTFQAIPFRADMPEVGERIAPQIRVTVDNVARELMPALESALGYRADLVAIYRQYRSDDLSAPCYGPVEFVVKKVTASGASIVGYATVVNLSARKVPAGNYTLAAFPSLLP